MAKKNRSILALALVCALLLPLAAGQAAEEPIRRLRVLYRTYGEAVNHWVDRYCEDHPSAMITLTADATGRENETLQKAVDDPAVAPDLMEMTFSHSDINRNIMLGHVAPINYLPLKEDVLSMDGRVVRCLSQHDEVYGYPVNISPYLQKARVDLLRRLGSDRAPETVEQYLRLLCRWYEKYAEKAVDFTVNGYADAVECQMAEFSALVYQYAVCFGERADFSYEDAAFRSALRALHRLGRFAGREPKVDLENAGMVFYCASPFPEDGGEQQPDNGVFSLPTVFHKGDTPRLRAELSYVVIPALAQNEGDAIKLIEYLKENRGMLGRSLLYPDEADFENPAALAAYEQSEKDILARAGQTDDPEELARLRDELTAAEESYFEDVQTLSEEERDMIDLHRAWLPYLSFENNYLAGEMVSGEALYLAAEDYFAGRMTTDQIVAFLNTRAAELKAVE